VSPGSETTIWTDHDADLGFLQGSIRRRLLQDLSWAFARSPGPRWRA
jgi:hypothetical protein